MFKFRRLSQFDEDLIAMGLMLILKEDIDSVERESIEDLMKHLYEGEHLAFYVLR